MSEKWRDIAEAPKTGQRVIVGRDGAASAEARWLSADRVGEGAEGWYSVDSDVSWFNPWRVCPPTHFQPLPDPPPPPKGSIKFEEWKDKPSVG